MCFRRYNWAYFWCLRFACICIYAVYAADAYLDRVCYGVAVVSSVLGGGSGSGSAGGDVREILQC